MRHTHVAWLIAAGEHPRAIMIRPGHASITTTINTYVWLMDGLDERTADCLDSLARMGGEAGVAQRVPTTFPPISPANAETPAEAGVRCCRIAASGQGVVPPKGLFTYRRTMSKLRMSV